MCKKRFLPGYILAVMLCILFLCTVTVKAEDSEFLYGDFGSWTDPDGTVWLYVESGDDEAAVYGVEHATMYLEIPSYVYDANNKGRKVTDVVGVTEANNEDFYFVSAENSFSYDGRMEEYEPLNLSFPDTVSYIGAGAFNANTLYEGESSEGHWRFLANVVLPQNPTLVIGEQAFCRGMNLQKVTFKEDILKAQPAVIEAYAFAYCPKLTEIIFPDGSTVDATAMAGCESLKQIVNAPGTVSMGDEENSLEQIVFAEGAEGICYYGYSGKLHTVTLPEGVSKIAWNAFQNCTALTTINLPEGLKEIGGSAFEGCAALNSFTTLPSSLESIGDRAFMGCKNLQLSVTYPAGQAYCLNEFRDSGITDITFSNQIQNISWQAFRGCKNLRSIQVEAGSERYYSVDGVLYMNYRTTDANYNVIRTDPGIMKYPAGKSYAGSYTVPDNVSVLGGLAFESCRFTEIHIPATVESFGGGWGDVPGGEPGEVRSYGVFSDMDSNCMLYMVEDSYADYYADPGRLLRRTYVAGNPVKITYKLNGGTNNAGNPVTFVGGDTIQLKNPTRSGYKFAGWRVEEDNDETGLWKNEAHSQYHPAKKELIKGVTFIADWTADKPASGSGNVTEKPGSGSVIVTGKPGSGSQYPLKKTISKAVYKLYANGTAEYLSPSKAGFRTSVTVPAKVKSGGKTYKVTKISVKAFSKCKELKSVVIGSNVTTIGKSAFSGCKKLKHITIKSRKLKSAGKNALKGIHKKCKIKVPASKLKAYKKLLKKKGQKSTVKISKI